MNGTLYNGGRINNMNSDVTLPMEQSYIENILRFNKGKKITAYTSFPKDEGDQIYSFTGTIIEAGRDHLIIKDDKGVYQLILMIYLDYVTFYEPIIYNKVVR